MATTTFYHNLAEIWSTDPTDAGPTGRFAEVIRGQVQDAGGNVLFEGTAEECRRECGRYTTRVPRVLVPTEWRDVGESAETRGPLWQLVSEPFTHYSASVVGKLAFSFPLYGPIDESNMLMLANNGTSPGRVTPELTAEADRIRNIIISGGIATTKTATIRGITAEQYRG